MSMKMNTAVNSPLISRQEALNYAFLSAIGVFILVMVSLLYWVVSPLAGIPHQVLLGQTADFPLSSTPYLVQLKLSERQNELVTAADALYYPSIWLVHTETGWRAFNRYTPSFVQARACLYAWTPTNGRFEDPCSGSKFTLDGRLIQPPATQNLTTYPLIIKGDEIRIDLSQPILGEMVEPLCRLDDSCL